MSQEQLIEELKREVVLHPDQPEVRLQLAVALLNNGDFAAAGKQAQKVVDLTSSKGGAIFEGARQVLMRALENEGRGREAFKLLEDKLRRDPDDLPTRDALIEMFLSHGRLDDALLHAEQALKHRPQELKRHLDIAEWSLVKGLMQRARTALEAAIRIAPEDPKVATQLRELYLDLGDEAAAERMAGERDRSYFVAQTQKALEMPSIKALIGDPVLASIAEQLKKGEASGARRAISTVGHAVKEQVGFWFLRAEIQLIDGDREAAEVSLREVVERAPSLGMAWNRLGDLNQLRGQFRNAVDCYKKAILLEPDDANAYEDLADVLQTLGEKEQALKMYRAAMKRDPSGRAEAKMKSLEEPPKGAVEEKPQIGRLNGLAWNPHGGAMLPIEAVAVIGHGNLIVSGNLGERLRESGQVAFSCLKARARDLKIEQLVGGYDLHMHFTETQIKTEGASAGLAMVLAGISAYTQRPLRARLAATGEITIHGEVKPIGGLHEKLVSALHGGVRTVLLPRRNLREAREVPEEVRNAIELIYVDTVAEAVPRALLSAEDFK